MLYCDVCAVDFGYKVSLPAQRQKGECEICHRRLGSMNVMPEDEEKSMTENISTELFQAAGFIVSEISSFPAGLKPSDIEPTLPCKIIGKDTVAFMAPEKLILAHPSTGKKIEITF